MKKYFAIGMKKYKNMKTQLKLKKFPIVEFVTHIVFYAIRIVLYTAIRGIGFELRIDVGLTVASASAIIVGCVFSLFLLVFALSNLLRENIYGYCLAAVVMFHNFLLSLTILILMRLDTHLKAKYWILGIMVSVSYIFEMLITIFFIYKGRGESNRTIFRKIGADPKINDMFSIRQRLQTFGAINIFIPVMMIKNLYLPPRIFSFSFEHINTVVLALTLVQHVFVYTRFHDEDMVQRKIAIAVTVVKAGFTVLLIVLTAMNYMYSEYLARVIKIILCSDLLLLTLAFLYYLWVDMKNFGKGLRKHVLFRTRELTL